MDETGIHAGEIRTMNYTFIGTEKFYLKVGETILSRGAEIGLKPDGLVTNSEAEKLV